MVYAVFADSDVVLFASCTYSLRAACLAQDIALPCSSLSCVFLSCVCVDAHIHKAFAYDIHTHSCGLKKEPTSHTHVVPMSCDCVDTSMTRLQCSCTLQRIFHVRIPVHMRMHTYLCIHVHAYVRAYPHIQAQVYIDVVGMRGGSHTCQQRHTRLHAYAYIYIYIYIYIHIHTYEYIYIRM